MYVPSYHAQTDHAELVRFMHEYSFATLCSADEGGPFATHLPLLVADSSPGGVVLEGHMARANPQWRTASGKTVLAIFHGPHHYISPSWYAEPGTVPTWNYLAVHATGVLRVLHDAASLRGILQRSVAFFEAGREKAWQPDPATLENLLGGIVGLRIEVKTLEGKWKLNQNHPAARRQRVIEALEGQGGEDARAIARRMRDL